MPIELKIPSVGESITEVEIGSWLKKQGESVEKDEPLVTLESEKATVELPAPESGTISRILKEKGDVAKVGEIIAYIEKDGHAAAPPSTPSTPEPQSQQAQKRAARKEEEQYPRSGGSAAARAPKPQPEQTTPGADALPHRIMPAAKRVLAETGMPAEQIQPTGPGGRLLKEDVLRKSTLPEPKTAQPSQQAPSTEPRAEAPLTPRSEPSGSFRQEEIVPMSRLRRTAAERLVQAQHSAALLTTFNEVEMTQVIALRSQHGEAFQRRYQVKLGFMSFFVKACIESLKEFPALNAEVRGTSIAYRNYFDIGVAIGGGKGLVVPVLRNAERLSFAQIEMAIGDFARRAKEHKLKLEELQGGTFTISNGGIYGSLLSTPIVNPPQSGVLGMHAIQDRPVARDGSVVVRPMMYLALTYDHRVVDGREAVTFLKRITEVIENPARMLLEI